MGLRAWKTFWGFCFVAFAFVTAAAQAPPFPWPVEPQFEIGTGYGQFQNYYIPADVHRGIDIMASPDTPVFAIEKGTVLRVLVGEDEGDPYQGVVIGNPETKRGWQYWHVLPGDLFAEEGMEIEKDAQLGTIVAWHGYGYHHVHLDRVRATGPDPGNPWREEVSIGNPLSFLERQADDDPPVIENVKDSIEFLFCKDNTDDAYLDPDDLKGQVDIIAKISDRSRSGNPWLIVPYKITTHIQKEDGAAADLHYSIVLDGELDDPTMAASIVYKRDSEADSEGNFDHRVFYFVVTNTDGNDRIETIDQNGKWDTTTGNGKYRITIQTEDFAGNSAEKEMVVTVNNPVN